MRKIAFVGLARMPQGLGFLCSGIRQEFRSFQGNHALPKVLATSATLNLAMDIKGTVHNGQIKIESTALPEGTQILITPMKSPNSAVLPEHDSTSTSPSRFF